MKINNTIILILLLLFVSGLYAQRPGRERVKTLKVAFITEQLDLTSKEAQEFWPLYNEHEKNMQRFRKQERQQFGNQLSNLTEISESEASELLSDFLDLRNERHAVKQKFHQDIKKVLPSKKNRAAHKSRGRFQKTAITTNAET